MKTFAQQLYKARIRAGISQSELARRTGINRVLIVRYESGEYKPEIDNLKRLVKTLRVTSDELLGLKVS